MGFLTRPELSQMALAAPGSYWYMFGEPNRYFDFSSGIQTMTGTRFAFVFHYLSTQIKDSDPTAKIIGPSVLNWDYTCIGCDGLIACEEAEEEGLSDFPVTSAASGG